MLYKTRLNKGVGVKFYELSSYTEEGPEDVEFTIPEKVDVVNFHVFKDCKYLKKLIIGKNVKTISLKSKNTLQNNYEDLNNSIEEIIVDNENPKYYSVDGILFMRGRSIHSDGDTLIKIPAKYKKDCITVDCNAAHIDSAAFSYCTEVQSISFQRNYKADFLSFEGCVQLSHLDGLEKINVNTFREPFIFSYCRALSEIELPVHYLAYKTNPKNYTTMFLESGIKTIKLSGFEKQLNYSFEILKDMSEHGVSLEIPYENEIIILDSSTLPDSFLKLKEHHVSGYDKAIDPKIVKAVKTGIRLKDSSEKSSAEHVQKIINEYAMIYDSAARVIHGEWGDVKLLDSTKGLRKSETADKLADDLDHAELMKFLSQKANGQQYRTYILAYARYAENAEIEDIVSEIKKKKRGQKKDKYWAQNAEYALYLNESPVTIQYFRDIGEMESYALFNGIDLQDLKDEAYFVTI